MRCASVARVRKMEQSAVAAGVPEYELMRRAGIRAAQWIKARYPDAMRFVVLCGGGNNGGDALVTAAHLLPYEIVVYSSREPESFTGCAASAMRDLPSEIPFFVRKKLDIFDLRPGDVVIDGLLGIGFDSGILRDDVYSYVSTVNESRLPVIALDLPSGLDANSGKKASNGVIKAELTLCFGVPKPGLFTADGVEYSGVVRIIDIGLDENSADGEEVFCNIDVVRNIFDFSASCHKNSRGRVLVWGASPEYPGAAVLSTLAALKSGAGIVRCASEADLSGRLCNAAIFHRLCQGEVPDNFMRNSDVLVCGCGWGSCAVAENLTAAWNFDGALILDADALNCLSRNPEICIKRERLVITPHPGEASRLLRAFGVSDIISRREQALVLAEKTGAVTVLKGKHTIVAAPDGRCVMIISGNSILATAGSGDVLAGVIGGLAAQKIPVFDAAVLGAYIHGVAGENAGRIIVADELPLIISDMIVQIRRNGFI